MSKSQRVNAIKYVPLDHQLRFHRSAKYIKALVGGFGAGKTKCLCMEAIKLSQINRGIPVLLISPTYKMLKRTLEIELNAILTDNNIRYDYHKTDHVYKIKPWNGIIWLASGDNPDALKGPNVSCVGIDEPFMQAKEVFDIALSRVRHPGAKIRCVFLTGTPEGLGWGYELLVTPKNPDEIEMVTASSEDNSYLPENFIQTLLNNYDEKHIEAYIKGKFVSLTAGRVYYNFDRVQNVRPLQYNPALPLIHCWDFNVNPMSTVIVQQNGDTTDVIEEIVLPSSNTETVCSRFIDKYKSHTGEIWVYGDASGHRHESNSNRTDYQIIKDMYFEAFGYQRTFIRAPKYDPSVRDSINSVNSRIHNRNSNVYLFVNESCKTLIRDLEQVSYDDKGGIDKSNHSLTHTSDALRYYVSKIYPIIHGFTAV